MTELPTVLGLLRQANQSKGEHRMTNKHTHHVAVGDIVIYKLNTDDLHAVANLPDWMRPAVPVYVGQLLPMIVTNVNPFDGPEGDQLSGQVILPSPGHLFVSNRNRGDASDACGGYTLK